MSGGDDFKDPKLELYRRVLRQAWEDGIVTSDEYALMERIREGLDITLEEHMALESEVYLNLARAAFEKKHHEEANALYKDVLDKDPENELARMNLGFHLHSMGQTREALECFDQVLEKDRSNVEALVVKGVAHDSIGEYEEALAAFEVALTLKDEDEWIWYNHGLALYHLGRMDEAKLSFKKAVSIRADFVNAIKYLEVLEA